MNINFEKFLTLINEKVEKFQTFLDSSFYLYIFMRKKQQKFSKFQGELKNPLFTSMTVHQPPNPLFSQNPFNSIHHHCNPWSFH